MGTFVPVLLSAAPSELIGICILTQGLAPLHPVLLPHGALPLQHQVVLANFELRASGFQLLLSQAGFSELVDNKCLNRNCRIMTAYCRLAPQPSPHQPQRLPPAELVELRPVHKIPDPVRIGFAVVPQHPSYRFVDKKFFGAEHRMNDVR